MEGHLSVTGIGPVYVATISVMTLVSVILSTGSHVPFVGYGVLDIPMKVLGAAMVLFGVWMWYSTVIKGRISSEIEQNHLVTDGMYACVRNPIYSAFTIAEWGILMIFGNALLLFAVPLYWALMTVMLVRTEERWLADLYGDEYTEYCRKVNRCMPWFPRR